MSGIILMGMPGAGKGTIGEYLHSKHGYTHFSSGDLLRDEVADQTEIGLQIKSTLDQGGQVPDELITKMVLKKLETLTDSNQSFVLDGFPQTSPQLEDLNQFANAHLSLSLRYISIIVDKETALERMSNRLSCSKCHKIYNKTSKFEPTCCLLPLAFRPSDQDERAIKRLDTFSNTTEKLLQSELKGIHSIDGNHSISEIQQELEIFLKGIKC
jgi:adenylate kinase